MHSTSSCFHGHELRPVGAGEVLSRRPDGVDHGKTGPLLPQRPQVVAGRPGLGEVRGLQPLVADEQRRVVLLQRLADRAVELAVDHRWRKRSLKIVLSKATEVALCRVRATLLMSLQWPASHQLDAVDRAERRDAHVARQQQPPMIARVCDGADQPEIDLPVDQPAVEFGRHPRVQLDTRSAGPVDGAGPQRGSRSAPTRSRADSS